MARRANGFGMKVLAYDPYVKELPEEFRSYVTLCSENEVISGCDFLSLHLPLNDEDPEYDLRAPAGQHEGGRLCDQRSPGRDRQ